VEIHSKFVTIKVSLTTLEILLRAVSDEPSEKNQEIGEAICFVSEELEKGIESAGDTRAAHCLQWTRDFTTTGEMLIKDRKLHEDRWRLTISRVEETRHWVQRHLSRDSSGLTH